MAKKQRSQKSTETLRNKRAERGALAVIYVLVLAFLIATIYVVPKVTGSLAQTAIVEYGSIQITDPITCYIIRDEVVYYANQTGTISPLANEDQLMRKGSNVMSISPNPLITESGVGFSATNAKVLKYLNAENLYINDLAKLQNLKNTLEEQRDNTTNEFERQRLDFYCRDLSRLLPDEEGNLPYWEDQPVYNSGIMPESYTIGHHGLISYKLDGYERALNPSIMTVLDKDKVSKLDFDILDIKRENTLTGEPLFKLVNPNTWYGIAWINPDSLSKYKKGSSIMLKLPEGDVKGSISDIVDNNGDIMVILKFNRYYSQLATVRKVETEIITSDDNGLLIQNEYITTEDNQPGLYVKSVTGEYKFTPIKIKSSDGTYSVIESGFYYTTVGGETKKVTTVGVYDEIKKPGVIN